MKRKLFMLMPVMLLAVWLAGAQQSVTGYVFEDVNANGKRDRKEAGIAGVGVSNGREVVLTDPSGKYILPIGSDDIVFVVNPTGYQTPVSADRLSKFYYIHKPQGSPSLKFAGVPPTGNLPASVDFPLYRSKEGEDFEILLFGDPQAYNKNELRYFDQRIVSELAGNADRFAFGISVGDLVGDNPDLFVPYVETIKKIGIPWYNVIGNHDLNHDAQTDQQADESYEQVFGPSTYSFNYGKAHFIIIKDILWPDPRD
ncbi:MAG TPA: metallophosphoesterase N-terminal domain-containing protein, partial [Prolixibacteraceae bacterium]|nr:metallophosphoesterase N-terminal domain-containing protein [Prolixibacteraceae bacterium]